MIGIDAILKLVYCFLPRCLPEGRRQSMVQPLRLCRAVNSGETDVRGTFWPLSSEDGVNFIAVVQRSRTYPYGGVRSLNAAVEKTE